jgi:phosphomannomutase
MIQFGTGGWRAVIGDGFTRANIRRVAAALARRMQAEGCAEQGLCAGYDRRFLSKEALVWFCEVLAGEGIRVFFVNMSCPTPQIMFTVKERQLPYGAMVTASHNPAVWNGIKLFTAGGRDAAQEVTQSIQEAANSLEEAEIRAKNADTLLKALAAGLLTPQETRKRLLEIL